MSGFFANEEDEVKDTEEIIEKSNSGGKYISINISGQEKLMAKMLAEYNKLCEKYMPEILQWNHIALHNACKNISISDWRDFLLDARIQAWLNDEIAIMIRAKQVALLDKVGDNNSTATVQALTTIMKAANDDSNKIEDNKIYIYSFMPLNQMERRLNNAQVLNSIPDEVRDAIQYIDPKGR